MVLSIILPSYNVKPYLETCIKSILNSGLSHEIYEVIIIDDGSTDGTDVLGKKLSCTAPNIHFYKQANRGVSAARNMGLSKANYKYVWFIDTDDFVKSELVLDMVYLIVENDLDALGMNYFGIEENGTLLHKAKGRLNTQGKKLVSGGEFYNLNYKRSYIWQYIFRKKIFISNNIRFNENMIMEDSEILPKLMSNIYRIGVFEEPVYAYRRRSTSLLRTDSLESELNFMNSTILLAESIKDQLRHYSAYKGLAKGLAKKSIQVNQILFLKFIQGNWTRTQREKFILEMKERKVFPFTKISNLSPLMNYRLNFWRYLVNRKPVLISQLYKKIN